MHGTSHACCAVYSTACCAVYSTYSHIWNYSEIILIALMQGKNALIEPAAQEAGQNHDSFSFHKKHGARHIAAGHPFLIWLTKKKLGP